MRSYRGRLRRAGRSRGRAFGSGWGSRRAAVVVGLAAALVSAGSLEAQSAERPLRIHRHLAVGNVSFLNGWEPSLLGGYLYQFSFGKSRVEQGGGEFGEDVVRAPHWFAHTLASGGWSFQEERFSAVGQVGAIYRLDSDGPMTISRVGLAAQGSLAPDGVGPVARVGFLYGNAGLSVGWIFFDGGRDDGITVNVDLLRCILQDLGLVDRCLIP